MTLQALLLCGVGGNGNVGRQQASKNQPFLAGACLGETSKAHNKSTRESRVIYIDQAIAKRRLDCANDINECIVILSNCQAQFKVQRRVEPLKICLNRAKKMLPEGRQEAHLARYL